MNAAVSIRQIEHLLLLQCLRRADADAEQRHPAVRGLEADDEARLGAGAAGGRDEMVDHEAALVRLRQQFERAVHVAQRADTVRRAARDHVGLAATVADLRCVFVEQSVEVGRRRILVQHGSEQPVQQHVPRRGVDLAGGLDPVLEQHLAGKPEFAGGGGRLADVVRLHGAHGEHRVGTRPERVAHDELELAGLVAAARKSGAVVALDPDLGTAQMLAESRQVFERRRQMRERHARETGQMHVYLRGKGCWRLASTTVCRARISVEDNKGTPVSFSPSTSGISVQPRMMASAPRRSSAAASCLHVLRHVGATLTELDRRNQTR